MRKITSEGYEWEIEETERGTLLSLKCPYGTVEFLAKSLNLRFMLDEIIEKYDKLKALGPLEKNSKEFL